jgi:hypothetical protein
MNTINEYTSCLLCPRACGVNRIAGDGFLDGINVGFDTLIISVDAWQKSPGSVAQESGFYLIGFEMVEKDETERPAFPILFEDGVWAEEMKYATVTKSGGNWDIEGFGNMDVSAYNTLFIQMVSTHDFNGWFGGQIGGFNGPSSDWAQTGSFSGWDINDTTNVASVDFTDKLTLLAKITFTGNNDPTIEKIAKIWLEYVTPAEVSDVLDILSPTEGLMTGVTVDTGTYDSGTKTISIAPTDKSNFPEYGIVLKFSPTISLDLDDYTHLVVTFEGISDDFKQIGSFMPRFNNVQAQEEGIKSRIIKYELGTNLRDWSGSDDWDDAVACGEMALAVNAIDVDDGVGGAWFKLPFDDAEDMVFTSIQLIKEE